eukprot:CAMPEP_0194044360 /NCGR_PEP_ID=MMETSP0009_2-20130614/15839_1 /TAXON_ID=210454 /ORGANISM="Grammatophora oceanica, Strain CCMP 410" /LENGTH=643 /DNA_ID=CAMNT_0038688859 /DNA_START=103 /DNA_END=2031 /DNA_ORIENTATION=+
MYRKSSSSHSWGGGSTISGTDPENGIVDDFQSSEMHSEGESTALSSLLPIVTSSNVRANAPRAALPDINEDYGMVSAGSNSKSNAAHKKKDPPRELDDYTVDTGRPIDSVFIPSDGESGKMSGSSNNGHRKRRGHRSSSNHSLAHSDGHSSVGGGSQGTGSVGGILETLGLDMASTVRSGDDESTQQTRTDRDSYSRGYRNGRSSGYGSRGSKKRGGGPAIHFRAMVILFFLLSVLYGAFQWITMLKKNGVSSRLMKHKKKGKKVAYHSFSEGEDRPIYNAAVAAKLAGGNNPSKIETKLAKVPQEADGPESLLDENPSKNGSDTKGTEEKAPSDSLASMGVSSKDKGNEQDSDDGLDVSLSVKSGFANVFKKDIEKRDTPFLWYIPRSGGGIVKNILSNCKDLVVASEVGATKDNENNSKLEVVTVSGHKYINVDTTTEAGIAEAKAMNLASSGLAELVVSPRFQEAASLFSPAHKARAFAMLRHPVERSASMYYFLLKHKVPAILKMSLEEYCKSTHVENNWMVRVLSGKMTGDVGDDELTIAKKALKDHVVIGLLDQKEESMKRFEFYYSWRYTENPPKQTACRSRIIMGDHRTNESAKAKIKEGSQAWSLLMWQNKLDMKLYKYGKALYLQQGAELFSD